MQGKFQMVVVRHTGHAIQVCTSHVSFCIHYKNEVTIFFVTLFALLLFCGSVTKSAQFLLQVWLPDIMEGPTPIAALNVVSGFPL